MDLKKIENKSEGNVLSSPKFTFNPSTQLFSTINPVQPLSKFKFGTITSPAPCTMNPQLPISPNHSSKLLRKIYEESICCDVVLKTATSEFRCHKSVLAGMSSYFEAMFQNEAKKEEVDNVVDLSEELKQEELKAILDYIYLQSDRFPHLSVASFQTLYKVSEKFELATFQKVCENALISKINLDNATDLLIFAAEFGSKALKKAAAMVIANGPD